MKKCVFFDRDGIVNKSPGPGYVESWKDFHLLPEFVESLRIARNLGYESVIVTNQRGVALGRLSAETLEQIHKNLTNLLKEKFRLKLLNIFYCPHERDTCNCRKPKPGMLLAAAEKHNINLKTSWMIGDNENDVEAGRNAGCRTIIVSDSNAATKADFKTPDMKALVTLLPRVLGLR
jgi:D-glycero-D-manno-heptose 1,7-bisphosphate phosphatase